MLKFYIATIFMLHGLAPMPGVAFGFVVATAALLRQIASGRLFRPSTGFRFDDAIFGVIFLLGLLPLLLTLDRVGAQNLLYGGLWLGTWLVCFWWLREWMLASRISFAEISHAAAIGAMLLAGAIIVEFVLANTSGLYLSDFIHFSIDEFPDATVLTDELRRPRGFTAEAGFSAIAFECLLPLSLAWLRSGSRLRRWLFAALTIPAYLLLASAASISFLAVTIVVYVGLSRGWRRSLLIGAALATLIGAIVVVSDEAQWLVYEVIFRKYLEFAPDEFVGGAARFSRREAYALALTIMAEQPWGIGWGGVSQGTAYGIALFGVDLRGSGLISMPLEIGASAGVVGMLAYLAIIGRKLARLARIDSLDARLAFVSLLWVSLHHAVVLEFWFPMIWFSLALADVVALRSAASPARGWRRAPAPKARKSRLPAVRPAI